jgi:hypothetical protein
MRPINIGSKITLPNFLSFAIFPTQSDALPNLPGAIAKAEKQPESGRSFLTYSSVAICLE